MRPVYSKEDNEWFFAFNPESFGSGNAYGPAHIFWSYVRLKDIGVTWSLIKKDLLNNFK